MIIKSITLHNFKSHADSKIDFDQITSFVGTSDHGKTTILKALHLICMHGNWPEDWIKKGTDSGWIEVETVSGNKVRRDRSRTSQSTTITVGGVTKKLDGVKTAEPYVRAALGFNSIVLDEATGPEDLNFIGVNDTGYSTNISPEVMLRKISGILGTNVIEDARNRLTKENKKLLARKESILEELGPLRARVVSRKGALKMLEDSFQKLNQLYTEWNDKKQKLEKLKKIRDQFESPLYTIHQIEDLLLLSAEISANLNLAKDQIKTVELLTSLKNTQVHVDIDHTLIETVQVDFKKLKHYVNLRTKLEDLNEEIANSEKHIIYSTSNCEVSVSEINRLKMQKQELLSQLEKCPVCGQVIK